MGFSRAEAPSCTNCVLDFQSVHVYALFVKVWSFIVKESFGKHTYVCIQNSPHTEVLATLVSMVFAIPGLEWDEPIDHIETFAGAMEVTKHEWMDSCLQ